MYCLLYEIIEAIWYVQFVYNAVHTYEDREIFLIQDQCRKYIQVRLSDMNCIVLVDWRRQGFHKFQSIFHFIWWSFFKKVKSEQRLNIISTYLSLYLVSGRKVLPIKGHRLEKSHFQSMNATGSSSCKYSTIHTKDSISK